MIPTQALFDVYSPPFRHTRLVCCGVDRLRWPGRVAEIERSERWADGGRPARTNAGSPPLACMRQNVEVSVVSADDGLSFRDAWRVVGDVLGPLTLPPLPPGWLALDRGIARTIAEQIYQDRDWGSCPVLADALIDAGVVDEGLQRHLRSGLPHYRGCWAIDYLTGRLTAPRRQRMRCLPAVEQPAEYELLLDSDLTPGVDETLRSCEPDLLVQRLPVELAMAGQEPLRRGETPLAYGLGWSHLYWHGEYVLAVRDGRFVLEREVLV